MIDRTIVIVLDSFGVGELPDADKYGDVGANTLRGIYNNTTLNLPNMFLLVMFYYDCHNKYYLKNRLLACFPLN